MGVGRLFAGNILGRLPLCFAIIPGLCYARIDYP